MIEQELTYFHDSILGDPWLQGGVALISQIGSRKRETGVWYHVMETSPGWPRHDMKHIGRLLHQICATGHVTNGSHRSLVTSVYTWPQLLFFFFGVYFLILSSADRDAIYAGSQLFLNR